MDTRSHLPDAPLFGCKLCVYCGGVADTSDHSPPRCFLQRPLPSDLVTLPACKGCNSGFSFEESVVKTILALATDNPEWTAERLIGGRVYRALARDARLRSIIDASRNADGNFELGGEVLKCFDRVARKTVQGLYFGFYERFLPSEHVELRLIVDQRMLSPEQVIDQLRPPLFREITHDPLPAVTPSSWVVREPVFFITMKPLSDGQPQQRLFRLVRETPVEWRVIQPGVFRFAFVKNEEGRAVCVLDLWQTLVVAVAAPWPDRRGPMRRGRKNPFSREIR